MSIHDAEERLAGALARDHRGRFAFCCKSALVAMRVRGRTLRFALRDNVGVRTGRHGHTIEHVKTGAITRHFAWNDLEWVTAGEPEMANGGLFQG